MRRPLLSIAIWLLIAAICRADGPLSDVNASTEDAASGIRAPEPLPAGPRRIPSRSIALPANTPSVPPAAQPEGIPAEDRRGNAPQANADPAQRQAERGNRDRGNESRHHRWYPRFGFRNGGVYPWVWSTPYVPGFFPGYYPATPVIGYNFTLPVLSTNTDPVVPPQNNVVLDPSAPAPAPDAAPRATNPERRARAGRFLGFGDSQFAKQKYLAALGRYKTATETAPDMPDGYLRQAFAHVALGQYENAAKAFRKAIRVREEWSGSAFRLNDLYVDVPISKTQHLENLAKAVEDNPFDADLLLVLGLSLYFDGQPDRAAVFLSRVAQFGGDETLLRSFLQPPKPAGAPDPPRAGRKVVF